MKYFNSVTGEYEDDGKEIAPEGTFAIPSGRMASPNGEQDLKFGNDSLYENMARSRANGKDIASDFGASPEKYPIGADIFGEKPDRDLASEQKGIDPIVKDYMQKKYPELSKNRLPQGEEDKASQAQGLPTPEAKTKGEDLFSEDAYGKAQKDLEGRNSGLGWLQFAAGLGDTIAGRDPSSSARNFDAIRNRNKDETVGELTRKKGLAVSDLENQSKIRKFQNEKDPSSQESLLAQRLAKQMDPKGNYEGISAQQINDRLPSVQKIYEIQSKKEEKAEDRAFKSQLIGMKSAESAGKAKELSGDKMKRADDATFALSAIKDMTKALSAGDNTFSLIGDNNFTEARNRFVEGFGRLESGGAINSDEVKNFKQMIPTKTDSSEMQRKKLKNMATQMTLILNRLGQGKQPMRSGQSSEAKKPSWSM